MRRKILPYDPKLKILARKLRDDMTFSEIALWNEIKNGQMMDYDFDRQRPILKYIVDFYCKDILLAIEIDGNTHDDELAAIKDEERQKTLEGLGVNFLRFNALDVVHDMVNVLTAIENWLSEFEEEFGVPEFVLKKRKRMARQ